MYKYDNMQAFDGSPIEVEFDAGEKTVSKALFVINRGVIVKEFLNPTSPIYVDLDEEDTGKLCYNNVGNLILYDDLNRKLTCDGELQFTARKEVYRESNI